MRTTSTKTRAGALANMVIGLAVAVIALLIMWKMYQLGLGTLAKPGPGMWPFTVASVVLLCTPIAIADSTSSELFLINNMWRALLTGGVLALFVLTYHLLGFLISGALALGAITRWVCAESWLNTIILAITTPLAAYGLFGLIFSVSLQPWPQLL